MLLFLLTTELRFILFKVIPLILFYNISESKWLSFFLRVIIFSDVREYCSVSGQLVTICQSMDVGGFGFHVE